MKRLNRTIALMLVISFIAAFCAQFPQVVIAAPLPINVYVEKYSGGTVSIRWDNLEDASSVVISYHSPNSANPGMLETITINQATNRADISGLANDVIYDISVKVYNKNGVEIGQGLLYFLPRITFQAKILNQVYRDVEGGGREIGIDPGINLKWAIPKVWNGTGFSYVHDALTYMQDQIKNVYDDGRKIDKFSFRINISTDSTKLNSAPLQASVVIDYESGKYYAYVSGNEALKAEVRSIDSNGYVNFDLIGKESSEAAPPQTQQYQLLHTGILPGTVYYMNIKPVFLDVSNPSASFVVVGPPEAMNGSPLYGSVSYMFTPIRFQLSRDDMNNVYVKIYRINQGSLDLPRLYYEVQSSDDPSIPGDWPVRRKIDDTYFSEGTAVTVISGVNVNNEMYYRIVVKSDSVDDRLESSKMPYTLVEDKSKPPVPMNVNIVERLPSPGTVTNPITKEEVKVVSTDVTISWDMPSDWDTIKNDLYFHILLSTNPVDLNTETELRVGDISWGSYPVKYRLVQYISANSPDIKAEGGRLYYTLKGFELFKGKLSDGTEVSISSDGYPDFLLPNSIYYIQMYTTRAADVGTLDPEKMSGKSLVKSFTTLSGIEREVPAPSNIKINRNEIDSTTGNNVIEIQFDKVDIDWSKYIIDTKLLNNSSISKAVYYDLYMSTRTEASSFVLIGTTQDLSGGDVKFVGADNPNSSYIRATISTFTNRISNGNNSATDPYDVFGDSLKPNTIYYFVIKTRLVIDGVSPDRESPPTPVISVTTPKKDISEPDETGKRPFAPTDFAVAVDKDGNPEIWGTKASFVWSLLEKGAVYNIICTSKKVEPNAARSEYQNDPIYRSFIDYFGGRDSDGDSSTFILDPSKDLRAGFFEYDSNSKTFKLTISEWLYPNRVYYFSIRAEINGKASVWVSIPVTTTLIEAPDLIEPVYDCEIGFFWYEYNTNVDADDYLIYIKGPDDRDFKELKKSEYELARDGYVFYARIKKLKPDSYYNVRVYRGKEAMNPVYSRDNIYTKDVHHEIEVRWRGIEGYDYEIAIRTEDDENYIVIDKEGLEIYEDRYGRSNPYYIEETLQTAGNDRSYYYAKIKSIPVELASGTVIHIPLKSNTKYYVKVRAVRVDPNDRSVVSYSKYIGPVILRTEFSQDDYDEEDRDDKTEAIFLDKIDRLEDKMYWEISTNDATEYAILLKGDRIANHISSMADSYFVLELEDLPYGTNKNTVYLPISLLESMKRQNKGLKINTDGISYGFRPQTLDIMDASEVKNIRENTRVKDILIEIKITIMDYNTIDLPKNGQPASSIVEIGVKAQGISRTYEELKKMFENKLYNSETGLVNQKIDYIKKNYGSYVKDAELYEYLDRLVEQIEKELSVYIASTLQSVTVKNALTAVSSFDTPLNVVLPANSPSNGLTVPYVKYGNNATWQKISLNVTQNGIYTSFNPAAPGRYGLFVESQEYADILKGYPDGELIRDFLSRYDVTGIFNITGKNLFLDRTVSLKEAVLLYEMIMGKTAEYQGLSIKEKAQKLGLDSIINTSAPAGDLTRQEAAGLVIKLYSVKTGANYASLRPAKRISIKDENSIKSKYYNAVAVAVENGIMELNDGMRFEPDKPVTRGELLVYLSRALNLK